MRKSKGQETNGLISRPSFDYQMFLQKKQIFGQWTDRAAPSGVTEFMHRKSLWFKIFSSVLCYMSQTSFCQHFDYLRMYNGNKISIQMWLNTIRNIYITQKSFLCFVVKADIKTRWNIWSKRASLFWILHRIYISLSWFFKMLRKIKVDLIARANSLNKWVT